ncbi:hypothetical protein L1049_023075 [Liquidambar formosana]|uniref:Uncharacterized protein n=1 Tax=Liquidambar formosana TaxID=63359 RepID=A0AAP0RDJ8_LIQFO
MKLKWLCIAALTLQLATHSNQHEDSSTPTPSPWPERFHAVLYMNLSDSRLQISSLWYDWPRGRNEWNNGTSFYYTLGADGTCEIMLFEVGIPRPDFLDGATYLGVESTDGFLCNVWEKVDFIWYYEDVVTKRPVRWDFYDGISSHVITFEVGAVLQDSLTQAPAYCFTQDNEKKMLQEKSHLLMDKVSLI